MSTEMPFQPTNTPFDFAKYETPFEAGRIGLLKQAIPGGSDQSALDIGCGPGFFSRELVTKGWKATAIDTDSQNIASASQFAAQALLGDAFTILRTLPEQHFQLALCLEIIEHMPKQIGRNLLQEIRRVMKPGGRLIISTPNRLSPEGLGGYYWGEKLRGWEKWTAWDATHVHIYSSFEILEMLRGEGFAVDGVTGYHYRGELPVIGKWKLPFDHSRSFPFNRFGFNVIAECHRI